MDPSRLALSVVIPAFDEVHRLPQTIESVLTYLERRSEPFEIVVADDGSTDGTDDLVRNHARFDDVLYLDRDSVNRGKGAALRRGVARSRGRRVLLMDADQATPIEELEHLEASLAEGADIAIGSRAGRRARVRRAQPWFRVLIGKAGNKLIRLVATPGIGDTQCGFKLFRGPLARSLFAAGQIDGFAFDVEILHLALAGGAQVREVPVAWHHVPESKVHAILDPLRVLVDLARIRLHRYDVGIGRTDEN